MRPYLQGMPPIESWSWFAADVIALAFCATTLPHLLRQRPEPGALSLACAVAAVAVWAALDVLMVATGDPARAMRAARLIYAPQAVLSIGWLAFALNYTGRHRHLRSWALMLVFALGAATMVLTLAGDPQGWLVVGGGFRDPAASHGFVPRFGGWQPVHLGWSWAVILFATGLLALHVAQSPRHVSRLVFVLGAPLMAAASHRAVIPFQSLPEWVNLEPLGLSLAGAALGWGMFGSGDESVAPVARNVVVEEMEDAVVVLDRQGRIADVNRSARETLGLRMLGPVPTRLATLWTSVREGLSTRGMPVSERVDLPVQGGETATFEVSVTLLGPQGGRDRTVLVLRDITRQVAMESELRKATRALHMLANTDDLTGLANRRLLVDRLQEELDRSRRYGRPFSLVLLDLDHFKRVNDTYGHGVGDQVLKDTAQAMERVCREMDLAGRMGGEEFAMILPETDGSGALIAADRLRVEIARCVHEAQGYEPFRVTASLGVVTVEAGAVLDVEGLLGAADDAMYRAKELGRNRVVVAT